jgi:CheY-like chemotaxis protein
MHRPAGILLAEDDTVDSRAFVRALAKLGLQIPLTVAHDGIEAWEMLKGLNGRAAFDHEDGMLVFDVNMPRLSGLELLARMRNDEALADAVVFMVTTSESEVDRVAACDLNVAGYISKADLAGGLDKAMRLMADCFRGRHAPADWVFSPRG